MLIIFGVMIWLFWVFFDTEVRELVRWIRYGEMWLVSPFLGERYLVEHRGQQLPFHIWFDRIPDIPRSRLNYDDLSRMTSLSMKPLKMVILSIIGLGGMWCMFSGPGTNYRRKLDLERLIEVQSKVFPVVTPFVKFNPAKQQPRPPGAPVPAELPLFAEALGPEEWLAYNSIQVPDGKLDRENTSKAFIEQLGKPWRGSRTLDNYKQVLLAAFALKASRKRTESEELIGRIAKCWTATGGLKLAKDRKLVADARRILKDKNLAGATLAQTNRHAFETTAMIRALQYAREEGGVLPAAQFVWLRAHDRNLWYALNNLGRQSYHMEALGAMSHFKAEKLTQRPIPVPKVDHAVDTIQTYMNSIKARPIPQLDYSKSSKRGVKKAV